MKLHSTMNPQEWKDLLNWLTARGCKLASFPETDQNGLFVDFKYVTVEYNGAFYYLQGNSNMFYPFTVTRYVKVTPYEKQQESYPREVYSTDELLEFMNYNHSGQPLPQTHKQRIYLSTDLYVLVDGKTYLWRLQNELAGYREKEILTNLAHITMQKHTKDYCVLRFHSADGNYFDYETKSHRITG